MNSNHGSVKIQYIFNSFSLASPPFTKKTNAFVPITTPYHEASSTLVAVHRVSIPTRLPLSGIPIRLLRPSLPGKQERRRQPDIPLQAPWSGVLPVSASVDGIPGREQRRMGNQGRLCFFLLSITTESRSRRARGAAS